MEDSGTRRVRQGCKGSALRFQVLGTVTEKGTSSSRCHNERGYKREDHEKELVRRDRCVPLSWVVLPVSPTAGLRSSVLLSPRKFFVTPCSDAETPSDCFKIRLDAIHVVHPHRGRIYLDEFSDVLAVQPTLHVPPLYTSDLYMYVVLAVYHLPVVRL